MKKIMILNLSTEWKKSLIQISFSLEMSKHTNCDYPMAISKEIMTQIYMTQFLSYTISDITRVMRVTSDRI